MDDRSTGLGGERTSGRGDDSLAGRAETSSERTTGTRTSRAEEWSSETAASADFGTAARESTLSDSRTREIRADIERTRGDMSETIDAIQDRLRPSTIASNAVSNVRQAANARVRDVAESDMVQDLRANPVPTAMVGIGIVGLAWLAFGGRDARARGRYAGRRSIGEYYADDDYYRGTRWRGETAESYTPGLSYSETGEGSGRWSGRESGRGGDSSAITSRATEYASEAGRAARQTTRRAQNQLQRLLNENPLMVGAAAAVVGAAVGMALPETERENALMGETRENVVGNVQSMAKDAVHKVQNAATDVVGAVSSLGSQQSEDQTSRPQGSGNVSSSNRDAGE
jgi:Protein of unknown function (DUF3618)